MFSMISGGDFLWKNEKIKQMCEANKKPAATHIHYKVWWWWHDTVAWGSLYL